jgi:hypothetical protein
VSAPLGQSLGVERSAGGNGTDPDAGRNRFDNDVAGRVDNRANHDQLYEGIAPVTAAPLPYW